MTALALLLACVQTPTLEAEAGFEGMVFSDSWTRFSAVVSYEGAPIDAELRLTLAAIGHESVVFRRPLHLSRKARMRVGFDVYLTSLNYSADVEIVKGGDVLRTVNLRLNQRSTSGLRMLAVGTPPAFLMDAMGKKPPLTMLRLKAEQLPPTPLSLFGVDAILIPEPVELDPLQEDALREWVSRGGRLIFGGARSTILRQNPFWREFCPMSGLEAASIEIPAASGPIPLTYFRGTLKRGAGSFTVQGEPVVVRTRDGAGEVVFLPLILDQGSVSKAIDPAMLLAELLKLPPPPKDDPTPVRRGFAPRMKEWLDGNRRQQLTQETKEFLRHAVPAQFSLRVGPLTLGVGAMALYIVLIGPVEYLRLRRKGTLRTGWRSFAILALVFGGLSALWSALVVPRQSRMVLVSLADEGRVRTYGTLRPALGGHYELESPGSVTPLAPSRPYGAVGVPEPIVATVSSGVRIPAPPSAMRMFVADRALGEKERILSAEWASADRKSVKLRNAAPYPLGECWAVSKDAVWRLGELSAESSVTRELKDPVPFGVWAKQELKGEAYEPFWWQRDTTWTRLSAPRYGVVLSFWESLNAVSAGARTRHVLQERGVDRSSELEQGEVVVVGSFDRNISSLRCRPGIEPETFGWARARVREAAR